MAIFRETAGGGFAKYENLALAEVQGGFDGFEEARLVFGRYRQAVLGDEEMGRRKLLPELVAIAQKPFPAYRGQAKAGWRAV